jgi:hypothetical protein
MVSFLCEYQPTIDDGLLTIDYRLPLSLLVFLIRADHADYTASPDDLALIADALD